MSYFNCFYELDPFDIDYDELTSICMSKQGINSSMLSHQRRVQDISYMQMLRNKYPFMGGMFNVYFLNKGLPIHIDAKRKSVLNIPIKNTEKSYTAWYNLGESISTRYDPSRILHVVDSKTTELCRMTLSKPTLMNVTIPHAVVNNSTEPRVSISWGLSGDISYEESVRLFNQP